MTALHRLFNPYLSSISEELPLKPVEIIEKVLLPQVIASLIADDLHISVAQAVTVAEESSEFGRKYHQDEDA
jgi:hypothetical protein